MSDPEQEFSGICHGCGVKYGRLLNNFAITFHVGRCYCCAEVTSVTEVRDYGYPRFPKHPDFINEDLNETPQ